MKKIFVILIVLFNVSSCTFSQKPSENKKDIDTRINELLKRDKCVIPDSLFSFFPDKSDKFKYLKIGLISQNAEKEEAPYDAFIFNDSKIIELYQCENKEALEFLMQEYRQQCLFSFKSESRDYFIVGMKYTLLREYDTLQLKENYLKVKDRVIVSFKGPFKDMPFLYDNSTVSGLPSGYEILILKSGNNFVLPKEYLYDWAVLPENLKHGYRSGVAFKEGEPYIIYWTTAW